MAIEVEKETQLSDEDTASSTPSHGYACTICFKVFRSGQALGGHQNCHLLERSLKQNTPNILASVLNHPLPGDEDLIHLSLATGSQNPNKQKPTPLIGSNQDEPKQLTGLQGGRDKDGPRRLKLPCKRKESEPAMRRRLTKNLIGEWEVKTLMEEVSSNEMTKSDDVPKAGDTIDLELRLKSNGHLDLELKLGSNW